MCFQHYIINVIVLYMPAYIVKYKLQITRSINKIIEKTLLFKLFDHVTRWIYPIKKKFILKVINYRHYFWCFIWRINNFFFLVKKHFFFVFHFVWIIISGEDISNKFESYMGSVSNNILTNRT